MKKYQSGGKPAKEEMDRATRERRGMGFRETWGNPKPVLVPGKTSDKPTRKTSDIAPTMEERIAWHKKSANKPEYVPLPKKASDNPKPVPYQQGGTIKKQTMKNKPAPKKKMSAKEMEAMKKAKTPMMKYGGKMGKKSC